METLTACPACANRQVRPTYAYNDLRDYGDRVPEEMKRSDYCFCPRCGLIYAARRQAPAEALAYYERFAELENRWYASYPPPQEYVENKTAVAREIGRILEDRSLLAGRPSVLHLRSDCGTLLSHLREEHGLTELFGLDYFDTNIRFAREQLRLANVGQLSAGELQLPFEQKRFDLIVSNHLLTHVLRPLPWLLALRDHVTPAGRVVFYNENDHLWTFANLRTKKAVNNFHKQLLTEESFANLLRLGGFEVEWTGRRKHYMIACARVAEPCAPTDLPRMDHSQGEQALRRWGRRFERRRVWKRIVSPLRPAKGSPAHG